MPLILTRPAAQAASTLVELQALHVPALSLPLIAIAPVDDAAPLHAAWRQLPGCVLAMFVSANAVQHFMAAAPGPAAGGAWPSGVLACCTGPGTSAALRAAQVPAAAIVEPPTDAAAFDSEALWQVLLARPALIRAGARALVVRGDGGRDWLAEQLRSRGVVVSFVTAYRRLPPQLDTAGQALLAAALREPWRHVWHFSSSEAVGQLQALCPGPGGSWQASRALATHPRIVQTAQRAGFGQVELVGTSTHDLAAWWQAHASLDSAPGPAAGS